MEKEYDFLVVVVVGENKATRFFVLTREEALAAKGSNKQLATTQQRQKKFQVKDTLIPHENQWDKIIYA